jgi:IclR family transcriptional regulator, KDG regulon repressor
LSTREKDSYSIHSVENALDLLEALCEESDDFRISHLSEKLGMNKTSVFRLLATFENRGYVEREENSGKYRLGLSIYEISQKFLSRMRLLRKARPVMEQLVRQCNETAYLVVRRNDEILFLDMVDNAQKVKIVSMVGRRFPLLSNAAGRVFLAFDGNTDVGNGEGASRPAPALALTEELATIRKAGICIDCHGVGEGVTCSAAPLFNGNGALAGVLALVGPDFRMSVEKVENHLLPPLKEAGEIISSKLGYMGHYLGKELF